MFLMERFFLVTIVAMMIEKVSLFLFPWKLLVRKQILSTQLYQLKLSM